MRAEDSLVEPSQSGFALFKARAEAVSAEVYRAASREAALERVLAILAEEAVADAPGERAVWCRGTILGQLDQDAIAGRLPGLSFDVTRARAAESRVGVSSFGWGLADTGTLVQDATDPALRLVSTLPRTHVALLPAGAILPDMAALLGRVDPRAMRYLAFVTGPSRTADIERVLTIGVHGPKRLVIVVLDEPEEKR